MPNILHSIGIEGGDPQTVYKCVATTEGFKRWWTHYVTGEAKVGASLAFRFPNSGMDFEYVEMTAPSRIEMRCVTGFPDWEDTHLIFEIVANGAETILNFKHAGWREETQNMRHCSTQWAYFLMALKHNLESGRDEAFGGRDYVLIGRSSPQA